MYHRIKAILKYAYAIVSPRLWYFVDFVWIILGLLFVPLLNNASIINYYSKYKIQ